MFSRSFLAKPYRNTARAFEGRLDLTGIVLTRIDGDGRGGAALSMRAVTGKPIKLLGTGEKVDALEDFHPRVNDLGPDAIAGDHCDFLRHKRRGSYEVTGHR